MQTEEKVSPPVTLGFFGRTAVGIVLLMVGMSLMLEGEMILTTVGMIAMGLVPVGMVLSLPTVSLPILVPGLISLPMIGIGVGGIGIIILCLR
ncbi:MAG: hypothetical protein SVG88_10500 [Halobacteriales archaeon]|nr:hypothetical protein [Halobacteriales archaeon]